MPITLNRLLSDNVPVDPTKNTFTGNGSQVNFTLTGAIAAGASNPNNLTVSLDGAIQEPNDDYSINNTVLTFTTAPDSGARIVVIYRNSPYTIGSTVVTDGSVTSQKIAGGNVTPDKLSTGAPVWDTSGNVTANGNLLSRNLLLQGDNTNAYIRPTNSNSALYLGSNNTNQAVILSNGNFGIGTLTPQADLHILSPSLGSSIGSKSNSLILHDTNPHQSFLEINDYRVSNGTGWETAGYRIQQKIDSTNQAFIQFNGNNAHGISFGAGSSTVNAHSVPTRLAIYENGLIDAYDNPIIGSPTTAKAHIVFGGNYIQSVYSNAPANTYIEAFAGNKLGYWWGFSAGWAWSRVQEGLTYWMRLGGVAQTVAGVAPDGSIGVPIKLKRFISANQMEFEWVTGTPNTGGQVLIGNGATSGYTYISNGVKESFNISLLVRNALGDYTVYFTNPMQNRDFIFCGGTTMLGNQTNWISGRHNLGVIESTKGTNYLRFAVSYSNVAQATVEDDITLVVFSNA